MDKEEETVYYRFDKFVSLNTNLRKSQDFFSIWFYTTAMLTLILLLYLNSINYQPSIIHDFSIFYFVLSFIFCSGLFIRFGLFTRYKLHGKTYSNFYRDMKNYLMDGKKIESKNSFQIIKHWGEQAKLIKFFQSLTFKKYFTIISACLLLFFNRYILLNPELLLIILGTLFFLYNGELKLYEARKLLENYVSFVCKDIFEEFYQFFNEISSKDFSKSEGEILNKLNELVNLGLLKIFGKSVKYSKNLRSFQNKSNLQEMINLTYKFERVLEYHKNIEKTSSIEFDKIGKYIEKIRNELDYELNIVESEQKRVLSTTLEFIRKVLPIIIGVLYVILFFLNIFYF